MAQLDIVVVMQHLRRGNAPAVQRRSIKASQIDKDIVSVLAPNLRMTARHDSSGSRNRAFHSGIASEASHVFAEFNSLEVSRSRSREFNKSWLGMLAWGRCLEVASACLAE